jgi:hypothetical protein
MKDTMQINTYIQSTQQNNIKIKYKAQKVVNTIYIIQTNGLQIYKI